MISNSGHDENGRYSGGKAGDQGGEWTIRSWYNRPWDCVLRHPNATVRADIAKLAKNAALNDKIGYDQSQRGTFWTQLKNTKSYDPANIKTACEADCSAGVAAIVKAVGYRQNIKKLKDVQTDSWTGNLRSRLKAAGFEVLTDAKYRGSDSYLLAGDILLNEAHHTCINVTDGSCTKTSTSPKIDTAANILQLAADTMLGKYGSGDARKHALGGAYDAVQKLINHVSSASVSTLAKETLEGKYGNGDTRKAILGSKYSSVMQVINKK